MFVKDKARMVKSCVPNGLVILLLLVIPELCSGYDLSLNQALDIAYSKNLILKKTYLFTKSQEYSIKAYYALKYPKLTLNSASGYDRIKESFARWTEPNLPPWTNQLSLNLSQPIYTGGKISNGINLAKAKKELSEYEEKRIKEQLTFDVISAYWRFKKAILLEELAIEKKKHLGLLLNEAKERFAVGTIPEIKLQSQQVAFSQSEYEVKKTKVSVSWAKTNLLFLLNLPLQEEIIPVDEPEIEKKIPPLSFLTQQALENRVEIKQCNKKKEKQEALLGIAKSERSPYLSLSAQHIWAQRKDEFSESISKITPSQWQVMLNLNLVLFDGGKIANEIEEAKTQLNIVRVEEEETKKGIILEVYQADQEILEIEEKIRYCQEAVSLKEEDLRQAYLQKESGIIIASQISELELSLKEAKTRLIEAKIDYQISQAKLTRAVGREIKMSLCPDDSAASCGD